MLVLKIFLFLSILMPSTAMACDIEGCTLPETLHKINGEATPINGIWTWMHHDLAVARRAANFGNTALALDLAHSLDGVLRRRLQDLIGFGGPESLVDFHQALQRVVREAGGWPLAEIKVGGQEA